MKNIGKRMAKGAVWMVLFKFMGRSLGLISTIILARLLLPDDFGLVAMAMSVVIASALLNAFSFDVVLIQKRDATHVHYNTAWSFQVLFGLFTCLVLFILARPTAGFYGEPDVEIIIYVLACAVLVESLANIGTIEFRKELLFRKEFGFLATKKLIGFCTTVPLAFYLGNYWALVIGMVAMRVGGTLVSYYIHPYRPRFSLVAWRELFNFSFWLFLNNIALFLRLRSADFVIGRLAGAKSLGLFSVGQEIAILPTTELVAPINRAVFSGYAKISHDLAQLRAQYLNVLALIALLALPAGVGIAAVADLFVPLLLGKNWLNAIPVIEILAFYGLTMAIQSNVGSVYLALGRPKILTLIGFSNVAVMLPLLVYLAREHGAPGAAWAYLLAALIVMPINYFIMFRTLALPVLDFVAALWRPVLASAAMYLAVEGYGWNLPQQLSFSLGLWHLGASVAIGALVFMVLVIGLWLLSGKPLGAERHILDIAQPRLRKMLRLKQR